jgi:phage terminase large subunit
MNISNDINQLLSNVNPLSLRINLFKQGVFDFISENVAKNSEGNFIKGDTATHEKQKEALRILTSNKYDQFLYGGAAGGAKSWTGMCWITFNCLAYPNTRWFIARNELKALTDSVLVTFRKVCSEYGITDYKFNAVKNFIEFPNGSYINLIEVAYKPSDPMYEDVGSTEYTGGWFEEVGEINKKAVSVLQTRVGRHLNDKYGLDGIVFLTCNPKQNWAKSDFYTKHLNGSLYTDNLLEDTIKRVYLNCLVTENPFIEQKYIDNLRKQAKEDKSMYERLFKGNWDYEDNPYQLAEQEMIEAIYTNDHVAQGNKIGYITADIAGQGSDKAVIGYWEGWNLVEIVTFDKSTASELINAIKVLRFKHRVPQHRVVVDADGLGWGVVSSIGAKSFKNNASAIRVGREIPNYKNLQTQCLYLLADKINQGELYISADLSTDQMQYINQELAQIQSKGDHDPEKKLECKGKAQIKQDIGRSPDYRDMIFMRIFFELKNTISLVTNWS